MKQLHSLLKRQLKRHFGRIDGFPEEWQGFIDAVNSAYWQSDADRNMLERSLDLSSQELIQANSDMRGVFDSSIDGILTFDQDCRYTVWNPGMERITGLSKVELLGKCAFDVFPFFKETGEDKFLYEALAGKTIIAKERPYIIPETGRQGFFEGHFSPLCNESGKIIGGLAIISDITERKRAEEALKQSQRTLSTLMGNLPGMAYRCRHDKDWTLEFANEGCFELTGYHPSDLRHNKKVSYAQLIYPEDLETVSNEIDTAIQEKKPFKLTYRIITASGQVKWVWEQGIGVYTEDGHLAALEGFITDVTERKQAQDALIQTNKLLGQLSQHILKIQEADYRTIARELHDNIAQSINAAKMKLERLEKNLILQRHNSLSNLRREIQESVTQLGQISKEVRRLSKQMRPEILDELGLCVALQSYVKDFQRSTGIRTEFICQSTDKLFLAELETHLYRIVQESLSNVAQHARAQKAMVRLERNVQDLVLSVEDDGIGFDVNQLYNSQTPQRGIGWINIQERSRLLGGRAEIRSSAGKGTRVTVWVPIQNKMACENGLGEGK